MLKASLVVVIVFTGVANADEFRDRAGNTCADVVLVKGSGELRGAIVSQTEEQLSIVVRREWLQTKSPQQYERVVADIEELTQASRTELLERIDAWLTEIEDRTRLHQMVTTERERIAKLDAAPDRAEPAEFLLLEFPKANIKRFVQQPDERRQLAMVGWRERLPRVEESSPAKLRAAVADKIPEWASIKVDLSARLAAGMLQSEEEWSARMAIWEYTFDKHVDLQGTGGFLVRTDDPMQAVDMTQILQGVMASGVGDLLKELDLGSGATAPKTKDWRKSAQEIATQAGVSGCRVTQVTVDAAQQRATVECAFLARIKSSDWQVVWRSVETTSANDVKADRLDRIKEDPRVKQALGVAQQFGIGDAQVSEALGVGAAAEVALEQANAKFFEFRDAYSNHLDGPPLRWESK